MPTSSDDRMLQDRVIHFLTDSDLRANGFDLLEPHQALRAQRFSRFLARRYYRDRLSRAFRYSAKLLKSRQSAEKVADLPPFDEVFATCILGSWATAKSVGELAVSHLAGERSDNWWSELLEYERAFFLQLATSESTPATIHPRLRVSTVVHRFPIQIAELLIRISHDEPLGVEVVSGEATLVFSRNQHGKIYAAELDEFTKRVLDGLDGERDVNAIAEFASGTTVNVQNALSSLAELGAVTLPK